MSDVIAALSWVNDMIFVSLVNTTLQITLLIALIGLIIRVFRIKSAPTRYSLWLFAILATLTLPILTPFTPQIDLARLHQQRAADYGPGNRARLGMGTGDAGDISMADVSVESLVAAEGASSRKIDVPIVNPVSIVYFIWCAGALSMLLKTVVVYGKLRKLRLCSSDVDSQVALETLSRLREKLGIRRAVALKSSPRVYAPISLGVFSPTIILPGGVLEGESMDELEMILAHELAHIKRLDYLVRFLEKALKVFLFFHPLFYVMKQNLAREREHICDDWVIHVTSHRSRYAEYLVDMLERVVSNPVNIPVTMAMAERKQDIPGRIGMIVDEKRKTNTRISKKAFIVMLIIGCLILPVIGGIGLVRIAETAEDEGKIVFVSGAAFGSGLLYAMDADGTNPEQLTNTPGFDDVQPAWSPDGAKIAFCRFVDSPNLHDIYVMNKDGSNVKRLTEGPEDDCYPTWSPDGKQIAFGRSTWEKKPDGGWERKSSDIYVMNADGANVEKLTDGPLLFDHPNWSPDGRKIAFEDRDPLESKAPRIWVMDADGSDQKMLNDWGESPAWSRDGKKIAFDSRRDGWAIWKFDSTDIYVMDADGTNVNRLTKSGPWNIVDPKWSPDGTKIAFSSNLDDKGNYEIYVMNADGSNVQRLTNTPELDEYWLDWTGHPYAVDPAGKMKSTWGKIKALIRPD